MMYLDEYDLPVSRDDAMDSCVRSGVITLARGNARISLYEKDGLGVRHPYEEPANNPLNFTNDQSIMLVAGLHRMDNVAAVRRLFWRQLRRGLFQQNFQRDKPGTWKYPWPHVMRGGDPKDEGKWRMFDFADIVSPSRWGALIIGGAFTWLFWTLPLCRWVNKRNIYTTAQSSGNEMNQLIAECFVYGTINMFNDVVLDWRERDRQYWSDRGEPEYHDLNLLTVDYYSQAEYGLRAVQT